MSKYETDTSVDKTGKLPNEKTICTPDGDEIEGIGIGG